MSDNTEPTIEITLRHPTLDSLALFVELLDHVAIDGISQIRSTSLDGGCISAEVPATAIWIPPIDFDQAEEEQP